MVEHSPSQKKERDLTPAAFEALLLRFDPDRARAGQEYEQTRKKLVKFFEWRGCLFPEEYADVTINRVAGKIVQGEEIHNLNGYFLTVAQYILKEYLREREKVQDVHRDWPDFSNPVESDFRLDCLQQCLQTLSPQNRDLIFQYHHGEKDVKIAHRQKLAERLKIPINALRIRAHRLRERLETCMTDCLHRSAAR